MNTIQPKKASRPVLDRLFDHLFRPKPRFEPAKRPKTEAERGTAFDLVRAIEKNDEAQVERLLSQGVDPQVMTSNGRLALVEALERGMLKVAQRLVQAGADPRASDGLGKTGMGVLWLDANGGRELDPTINPKATGEARKLYEAWQVKFPVASKDDYFSSAFRDERLTAAQHARLELESDWKSGTLVNENPAGLVTRWDEVDSHRSLKELQQMRRARLIPEPDQRLGVGKLPTPGQP